jgi:predicted dehydrogenase
MGTEGSIEITPGSEEQPALGLWFYEPDPVRLSRSQEQEEMARIAGATVTRAGSGGLPILFTRDQIHGQESLLSRELKYARRWLYSKGIAIPREDRPAVDVQLDSFFESCRGGRAPRADLNAGLEAARAVILSNLAMDEGRRVPFAEIERLSRAKPRKT